METKQSDTVTPVVRSLRSKFTLTATHCSTM